MEEELEQDEVALTLLTLAETIKNNRVKLMSLAAAIALVAVIGWGYDAYRQRIKFESSAILNQANSLFADIPRIKDDEERKKRLQETIGALQTLIDRYTDSPSALEALYLQGNCYYYMDDVVKAQTAFQAYANKATASEDKAKGEIALGYALENEFYLTENRAKIDEAVSKYKSAETTAPAKSYLYYLSLMSQARILELTHKDEEALAVYQRVVAERPSPIVGAVAPKQDNRPDLSGGIVEFAKNQVAQSLSQMSLFSSATLRVDRLNASIKAAKSRVKTAVTAADDVVTTGSATLTSPTMTVTSDAPTSPAQQP